MHITLYQAQADLQNKIMLCTDEDGVLDMDKLHAIEAAFEHRAVAYVAVSKTMDHAIDALKAQRDAVMAEFDRAITQREKNRDRLLSELKSAMRASGVKKIESDDGMLSATLSVGSAKSVHIDDESSIPEQWRKEPKPRIEMPVDKTALRAALEAGEPVPDGVSLAYGDVLRIKK